MPGEQPKKWWILDATNRKQLNWILMIHPFSPFERKSPELPRTAGGPEGLVDLLRHLDEALRVLNRCGAVDAPHGPAAVQAQQVDACGGSCQVCKVYRLGILPTLAENDSCIEEGLS